MTSSENEILSDDNSSTVKTAIVLELHHPRPSVRVGLLSTDNARAILAFARKSGGKTRSSRLPRGRFNAFDAAHVGVDVTAVFVVPVADLSTRVTFAVDRHPIGAKIVQLLTSWAEDHVAVDLDIWIDHFTQALATDAFGEVGEWFESVAFAAFVTDETLFANSNCTLLANRLA